MSSKIFSGAVIGLDTQITEVKSDISYGLRSFDKNKNGVNSISLSLDDNQKPTTGFLCLRKIGYNNKNNIQ
ncbi:hypothetical protein KJ616_00475 [Patescibacteria group bacterium]|nr:hypothetical protein [Patescibacteria group bacterium]